VIRFVLEVWQRETAQSVVYPHLLLKPPSPAGFSVFSGFAQGIGNAVGAVETEWIFSIRGVDYGWCAKCGAALIFTP
jgi:hypothetical protein